MPDGGVWTAGGNLNGEIGDGTSTARLARTQVLSGAVSVAAGANHTAAVAGGQTFVWGHNWYGQVGDSTQGVRLVPTLVPGLTDVVAVAAGGSSTFSLKSDGTVMASGWNGTNGLGDGSTAQRLAPVAVSGITDAIAIAAGLDHALALRQNGTVVAWGHNQFGKLGDGTTTTRLTPVAVTGLTNIVAIAAGQAHSLALDSTGHVFAWGSGFQGQLGQNTTADHWTPIAVPSLANVTAIAAGAQHSVALVDAQVWTWGSNASGALGSGGTPSQRLVPAVVPGLTPIASIAAARGQTYAFAADGGLYAWGENGSGQLGDGSTDHRLSPTVLAEAGGAWRVAVPRFSVPGGTYGASQTVLVTSATPGATVHYTSTGVDPTESDPVPPGGGVAVDQSVTLKARAWKPGQPPSPVSTATYTLRPATPAIAPFPTLYTTAQNVTITTSTSGAAIRYTLDGTDPSATSPAYSAPFAVSTATTVKARAFNTGWDVSLPATASYTFNYGTLATPTASPAGGLYTTDPSVTLSGPAGASLR
jgi:alpha-tubulin suppressor-like RCC1 family protein